MKIAALERDSCLLSYQVDDKDVASPGRDHVEVGQSCPGGPVDGAGLDGLDPQVVGEHEGEDGDALVVVGSGHRS